MRDRYAENHRPRGGRLHKTAWLNYSGNLNFMGLITNWYAHEREGFRVKITLKDEQSRCHRPHPGEEAKLLIFKRLQMQSRY